MGPESSPKENPTAPVIYRQLDEDDDDDDDEEGEVECTDRERVVVESRGNEGDRSHCVKGSGVSVTGKSNSFWGFDFLICGLRFRAFLVAFSILGKLGFALRVKEGLWSVVDRSLESLSTFLLAADEVDGHRRRATAIVVGEAL